MPEPTCISCGTPEVTTRDFLGDMWCDECVAKFAEGMKRN